MGILAIVLEIAIAIFVTARTIQVEKIFRENKEIPVPSSMKAARYGMYGMIGLMLFVVIAEVILLSAESEMMGIRASFILVIWAAQTVHTNVKKKFEEFRYASSIGEAEVKKEIYAHQEEAGKNMKKLVLIFASILIVFAVMGIIHYAAM